MTDQQKKIAAGAGFAVVAGLVLFFELHDSGAPAAPPAAPVVTTAGSSGVAATSSGTGTARHVGTTAAELDPTLHMAAMLRTEALAYSGSGRNIFSATSVAAAAIPKPVGPARPQPVLTPVAATGPIGPPPPPPIDLKFFGTTSSERHGRQVLLLKGDDVFIASAGDIVQRRYKVVSIASNSILVEDLTDNHQQSLPLLSNP